MDGMEMERRGPRVVSAKRGRRLAELILAESERAGLGPGSRLPTERQLAADLGVTRSGVRLRARRARGRRAASRARSAAARSSASAVGTGASTPCGESPWRTAAAAGVPGHPAAGRPTDFAPADVMTIRRLLEPQAHAAGGDVGDGARTSAEMERCVAGGDQAASYEEFETWDLALHRCIMAAAHSPLLAALYSVVESARHGQVWGDLKRRSASSSAAPPTRRITGRSSPRSGRGTPTPRSRRCAPTWPGWPSTCSARRR